MKTYISTLLLIVWLLQIPLSVHAEVVTSTGGCERAIDCTVTQGSSAAETTTTGNSSSSPLLRPSSGQPTTNTNVGSFGGEATGTYNQARTARNQANGTMIAAFGMAAVMVSMCNPPVSVTPCYLAGIAAMAGIVAGQKKGDTQRLMDGLGVDGDPGSTGGDNPTDTSITTTGNGGGGDPSDTGNNTFARIKEDLAKKGYGINADGSITGPNGKTVANDLNSQSLSAAGLSPQQISDLAAETEKLRKDIREQAASRANGEMNTLASSGDAGGMGDGSDGFGRTSLDGGDREASVALNNMDRVEADRDPAAWAGYFTKFGDSTIGVPQSDIFLMVEKRVADERKIMGQ